METKFSWMENFTTPSFSQRFGTTLPMGPRRTPGANPKSSLSGEWTHSWTLLKTPRSSRQRGRNSFGLNFSTIKPTLFSICVGHLWPITCCSQESYIVSYRLCLTLHGFLQLHLDCCRIKTNISFDTGILFRRRTMYSYQTFSFTVSNDFGIYRGLKKTSLSFSTTISIAALLCVYCTCVQRIQMVPSSSNLPVPHWREEPCFSP